MVKLLETSEVAQIRGTSLNLEVSRNTFFLSFLHRRHIYLEMIEQNEIKGGTRNSTGKIKSKTTKLLDKSRTNCFKSSFSDMLSLKYC